MERTISREERIRRAEEIYNRRKNESSGVRVSTTSVNTGGKKEYNIYKKLILKVLICAVISIIFYLIKNSNYVFSQSVLEKADKILSYDINFQNLYQYSIDYYNNNIKTLITNIQNEQDTKDNNQENIIENEIDNNKINEEENINQNEQISTNGVGGGEEGEALLNEIQEVSADEPKELSQMEIDANEIKSKYSLIIPLKGYISSRFGQRTPTEVVSANHAGIDIAVNEGTIFNASMEGIVTDVVTEGGYGNHVYIQKDDVITLYAHCKTIYVKKGDTISQGQQIGEVGSTGNATGPHLHFEIRKNGRVVNPEYVLNF